MRKGTQGGEGRKEGGEKVGRSGRGGGKVGRSAMLFKKIEGGDNLVFRDCQKREQKRREGVEGSNGCVCL